MNPLSIPNIASTTYCDVYFHDNVRLVQFAGFSFNSRQRISIRRFKSQDGLYFCPSRSNKYGLGATGSIAAKYHRFFIRPRFTQLKKLAIKKSSHTNGKTIHKLTSIVVSVKIRKK